MKDELGREPEMIASYIWIQTLTLFGLSWSCGQIQAARNCSSECPLKFVNFVSIPGPLR